MRTLEFKSLDYVVLFVADVDVAEHFYRNTLGLELQHRSGDYVQFTLGDTRLSLYARAAMSAVLGRQLASESSSEKFELGFKVGNCDAAVAELAAGGATVVTPPKTRPWGQRTAYIADPDGNLIELAEDLRAS